MHKKGKLRTPAQRAHDLKLKQFAFQPGRSGNPGGRPKKLTQPLEHYLARKDKSGKQYAQKLIEAMVRRAIRSSDAMVKEIFERVEGHVPHDPAEAAQFGVKVIVVDMPRPPRHEKNKVIDVSGNGHKTTEEE